MVSEKAPVLQGRIAQIARILHAKITETIHPEGIGQVVLGHRFYQRPEEFDALMVHRMAERGDRIIRGWQLTIGDNESDRGGSGTSQISIGKLRRTYNFVLEGLHAYDPDTDSELLFYDWVEAVQDQLDGVVILDNVPGQPIVYPKDDGTGFEIRHLPQNVVVGPVNVDYDMVGGEDSEENYWGLLLHRAIMYIDVHEDLTLNRVRQ